MNCKFNGYVLKKSFALLSGLRYQAVSVHCCYVAWQAWNSLSCEKRCHAMNNRKLLNENTCSKMVVINNHFISVHFF